MNILDRAFLVRVAGCCRNKGAMQREAFTQESVDFVRWCLARPAMTPREVQTALERMGLTLSEGAQNRRGPLTEGETVLVQAIQNTNPLNTLACEKFDQKMGVVSNVSGRTVTVSFGSIRVDFDGVNPGVSSGLYRHTPSEVNVGKPMIEVIYIRDQSRPVSQLSRRDVEQYIMQGLAQGESRQDVYYSGLFGGMAIGGNGFYFSMSSQQRGVSDAHPRRFNPQKGQVLYVGRLGKRPGGWKADLARQDALEVG